MMVRAAQVVVKVKEVFYVTFFILTEQNDDDDDGHVIPFVSLAYKTHT